MGYAIATLKTDVRKLLDEQGVNDSGFTNAGGTGIADTDDSEIDALIALYAPEARNFVLSGCEASLLEKDLTRNANSTTPYVAKIDDVLRLVRVTSSSWMRDVTEFIDKGSKDYTMFAATESAGTNYSPKVAVSKEYVSSGSASGMKTIIEPSPAVSSEIYYVSTTAATSTELKVDSALLQAAVRHYLAGLVCQSLGDDRADNFFQIARIYMGVSDDRQS